MRHLGFEPARPKVAVFDFTSCEGCELQLVNKEETLGAFLRSVEVVRFRLVSSSRRGDWDVAFVEGAITRADEVERLRAIREQARVLVALGSCACFGGVARQKAGLDPAEVNRVVYGDAPRESGPARGVHELVKVDVSLPGCPASKDEVERLVRHMALGVPFALPVHPVCVDCRQRYTSCLMDRGDLCLGSVARGGCEAPCPAGGLGCWGCRGPAPEANVIELRALARARAFDDRELDERLAFFGGFEGHPCA